MYKAKKFISYMALCVLIFSLCACGEKGSENAAIYGETVGGLEDNELFAIIDTNASLPVLLVTSQVYNDGLGNHAFYGAQRSPFCFRTAAFRSQRPPIF